MSTTTEKASKRQKGTAGQRCSSNSPNVVSTDSSVAAESLSRGSTPSQAQLPRFQYSRVQYLIAPVLQYN